jgi:hypothetical protein
MDHRQAREANLLGRLLPTLSDSTVAALNTVFRRASEPASMQDRNHLESTTDQIIQPRQLRGHCSGDQLLVQSNRQHPNQIPGGGAPVVAAGAKIEFTG